ncbi:MAG: glycosyl hydrolase family 31 [Bacteroidaceae bacterium]|nr:glycosyl hydrolase family 31 [Bacteroidaceae bacterium]
MKKETLRLLRRLCLASAGLMLAMNARADEAFHVFTHQGQLSVEPMNDRAVRVRCVQPGTQSLDEFIYTATPKTPKYTIKEDGQQITLTLREMSVVYDKATASLRYLDREGRVVLQEQAGSRKVVKTSVQGVPMVDVAQTFVSPDDEFLYGTGQFQDGYLNVRGLTRRLTQVNTQISIPFVLSNKGYGLLWNNYGLTDFNPSSHSVEPQGTDEQGDVTEVDATGTSGNRRERRVSDTFRSDITIDQAGDYAFLLDVGQTMARKLYLAIDGRPVIDLNNLWLPPTGSVRLPLEAGRHSVEVKGVRGDRPTVSWRRVDNTTTLHSPVAQALDYTVMVGTADQVVGAYRQLTGEAPLMPDYMLGYVHCRERYNTQEEIIADVDEFQRRQIPLDVIVQDWQWWGKHGWNAMRFDEDRYPDPKQLTDELHAKGVRLMLSVWSKIEVNSEVGKQFAARDYYIPGTDWVDFFNPKAADFYWQNFRDRLVRPYGIDVWWLDATEPENDDLHNRFIAGRQWPGDLYRNAYPLRVVNTVFRGLKEERPGEVPVILTRSSFPGMQRYNAVVWSGDVGNDMDCLRRQISGGLSYSACGLPWWTYDAGGFFRPGNQYNDDAYKQRMLRWIQTSVFLPIMRVHGYMSQTEPWRYDAATEQIFTECIRERQALKRYLQQCARRVADEGYTLMRPLVFDFSTDEEALRQSTEYMFGPKYLVCPITEENVKDWKVYLPRNKKGWTDHYTGQRYDGGQYVTVTVSERHIPVFERN